MPTSTVTRLSVVNVSDHCVDHINVSRAEPGNNQYFPLFHALLTSLFRRSITSHQYVSMLHAFILTLDEYNTTLKPIFKTVGTIFDSTIYRSTFDDEFTILTTEGNDVVDSSEAEVLINCSSKFLFTDNFKYVKYPEFVRSDTSTLNGHQNNFCVQYHLNDIGTDKEVNGSGFCYCCSSAKSHTTVQRLFS